MRPVTAGEESTGSRRPPRRRPRRLRRFRRFRRPRHDARAAALLAAARAGDERAAQAAFALLYDELRRLARARLRPHGPQTLLDTTSLVHESFLKLAGAEALPVNDRAHFFAYASRVMRSVIVDHARARGAARRGGDVEHVALDTFVADRIAAPETDLLDIDEALSKLAAAAPRLAQVVEMRWFGGLEEEQVAEALGVSSRTVRRDWEKARVLLAEALRR
jgi:RNA polymerase sigma factor (TIGR02999 family)